MKMYLLVFASPTISTHVLLGVVQSKALAERILIRPVVLGELLVDDGDARRVDGILDAEVRVPREA